MASRLKLQKELETILGSRNVYYNPPETLKMKYPCIRYTLSKIDTDKADNINYIKNRRYQLTVIDTNPDTEIPDELLDHFAYCSSDRTYRSDGFQHHVLTLYY